MTDFQDAHKQGFKPAGPLPLAHALAVEGQELRFAVRASERNPAELEVSAQRCHLP